MVDKGILVEVNDWDQYIGTINNGTVASVVNGCWITSTIQAQEDQSGDWGVTTMPRLDKLQMQPITVIMVVQDGWL